jgi:anti-sigma factor RsiW
VTELNELTCLELVDLVTAYFEGALAESERRRFEAHLEACGHCQRYLQQMRRAIEALGELRAEAVPRHVRDELLRTFRGWKREAES